MGKKSFLRWPSIGWALVVVMLVAGCDPTEPLEVGPNQLISAGDTLGARDVSLERWQSEQSAVRAIDARNGLPIVVVGFNDGGGTLNGFGLPVPPGTQNKMGYAFLRDGETQWTYSRIPLGSGDINAANGDPWLATNVTRDRIYYASLGISRFTADDGPDSLLVAVHDDMGAPSFWRPAFSPTGEIMNQGGVSAIPAGNGADKPSIAVSPDITEDVYLVWSCPRPTCSAAQQQSMHFMRVDGADGSIHRTSINSGGPRVQNPIVTVDPREPDSVFVAFQILTSSAPVQWDVRVVKSIDRGDSFTLGGGELNGFDPVTPATDIRAAAGAAPLRNGIFMDYFAAEDGWHYLAYEDEGLVYFTRAEPIEPVPGFPPLDGLAWAEPVRVSIPDSPSLGVRNFQPAVAGLGSRVVVAYYEQSLAGNDAATYVLARVSDDQGETWRTTTVSRDAGDSLMFEPCALTNRRLTSYFGDYIDVQPLSLPALPDTGFFVTWTDSRVPPGETGDSCRVSTRDNAVHHHTYGAVVR